LRIAALRELLGSFERLRRGDRSGGQLHSDGLRLDMSLKPPGGSFSDEMLALAIGALSIVVFAAFRFHIGLYSHSFEVPDAALWTAVISIVFGTDIIRNGAEGLGALTKHWQMADRTANRSPGSAGSFAVCWALARHHLTARLD
jgi:hypothetical protein